MQDLPAQGVVLDFLHQREPLRTRVIFHLEIHQQVLGDGMVDEVFHFFGLELEVLGLGLTAIDHGRDAPCGAQSLRAGAPAQRPGKGIQCYRFHFNLINGGASSSARL